MTTRQDETPTSRRALRERERARSQAVADSMAHGSDFSAVPPPGAQQGQAPSYRVRDYSPDSRGSQFSTTVSGPDASAPTPIMPRGYRPEPSTAQAPGHAPASPAATEPVVGRTLTRRELRELRQEAEAAANPAPSPDSALNPTARQTFQTPAPQTPYASPSHTPPSHTPPSYAAPSYAASAPQSPPDLVDPLEPRTHSTPAAPQMPSAFVDQAAGWQAREPEPAPDVMFVPQGAYAPPAPEFELAPDYAPAASHAAPAPAPVALAPEPEPAPAATDGRVRPEGHWSRQADLDDRTQIDDVLPSRDISRSDAITTSALVLPSMPQYPIGALSSTGEILVTGSIDLPRMLGATGIHPARFDAADFDSIMDADDREDSHPNSAPVRAIRAVSTHTSTQGIMAAKRPRSKVPTILLAGFATVMGIGVVVLFVGGMLLDLF